MWDGRDAIRDCVHSVLGDEIVTPMKKVYYTEKVKQKNGRTCPITKVKFVQDCPACGMEMVLNKIKKGGIYKKKIQRFECTQCDYKEIVETDFDKFVRKGFADKDIGILKPHIQY